MKPPQPSEALILRACLQYLGLRGVVCWRQNTAAFKVPDSSRRRGYRYVATSMRGVSDILGVLPGGRFLAVEVKSATGRLRPEQRSFLDEVNRQGGLGIVVRSVEELAALLTVGK